MATITAIATTMATAEVEPAFAELPLYVWLSPSFPVGAFAYSHALEWAVEAGDIAGLDSLIGWLGDLCEFGAPASDAVLFAVAWRAARAQDWPKLLEANALAAALAGSQERRLETTQQGAAFVIAARTAWNCSALECFADASQRPVAYPVAVAAASAGRGFRLEAALPAFLVSVFANLVSASVRLSAIGQTDGQRALAALMPRIEALARRAFGADLADVGSCAFRSDLAAMRHETQYSRLFRS